MGGRDHLIGQDAQCDAIGIIDWLSFNLISEIDSIRFIHYVDFRLIMYDFGDLMHKMATDFNHD